MKTCISSIIATLAITNNLFAAEAGMPQLDPTYWASQVFWLIVVFTILYISIAKFYLPKIKNNLDNRENKIIKATTSQNNPVASSKANP
jgi:F-type H+-transporting ATPase subunit b